MNYIGIDRVSYGVEDMEKAVRYLVDWGLEQVAPGALSGALFRAKDGAEVRVAPIDAPDLPPAIEPGSTLREVMWGVKAKSDLARIAAALGRDQTVTVGRDGTVRARDPIGLGLAFRVSRKKKIKIERAPVNTPTRVERVNRPSRIYERAEPQRIGHVVLQAPDETAMERFYTEILGFRVTDRYPGWAMFLRCQKRGDHHNLFVMKSPDGKPHLQHVAFTVRDVHEVLGGGIAMSGRGWQTEVGPGRHPVSSAYFWYFKSPCGGSTEYFADEDHVTERWKPRDFVRGPKVFAEWLLPQGIAPHGPPRPH